MMDFAALRRNWKGTFSGPEKPDDRGPTAITVESRACKVRADPASERLMASSFERQNQNTHPYHKNSNPLSNRRTLIEKEKREHRHEQQAELVYRGDL